MNWMKLVNWKTSGCAVGLVLCNILGTVKPAFASLCDMLDGLLTIGGFLSAADAQRVNNVVAAVDHLIVETKSSLLNGAPKRVIDVPVVEVGE